MRVLVVFYSMFETEAIIIKLAGILRDKSMADKFMYFTNYETQNYPFCRLQLMNLINKKTWGLL